MHASLVCPKRKLLFPTHVMATTPHEGLCIHAGKTMDTNTFRTTLFKQSNLSENRIHSNRPVNTVLPVDTHTHTLKSREGYTHA